MPWFESAAAVVFLVTACNLFGYYRRKRQRLGLDGRPMATRRTLIGVVFGLLTAIIFTMRARTEAGMISDPW